LVQAVLLSQRDKTYKDIIESLLFKHLGVTMNSTVNAIVAAHSGLKAQTLTFSPAIDSILAAAGLTKGSITSTTQSIELTLKASRNLFSSFKNQPSLPDFSNSVGLITAFLNFADPKLARDFATFARVVSDFTVGISRLTASGSNTRNLLSNTNLTFAAIGNLVGLISQGADQQLLSVIAEQVVAIRNDLKMLHQQMHTRFDQLDVKLNNIFLSLSNDLDRISADLKGIQSDTNKVLAELNTLQYRLNKLEERLNIVAQSLSIDAKRARSEECLGAKQWTPYDPPTPREYSACLVEFLTWATHSAYSPIFIGQTYNRIFEAKSLNDPTIVDSLLEEPLYSPLERLELLARIKRALIGQSTQNANSIPFPNAVTWIVGSESYLLELSHWQSFYSNRVFPGEDLERLLSSGREIASAMSEINIGDGKTAGGKSFYNAIIENYKKSVREFDQTLEGLEAEFRSDHGIFSKEGAFDIWLPPIEATGYVPLRLYAEVNPREKEYVKPEEKSYRLNLDKTYSSRYIPPWLLVLEQLGYGEIRTYWGIVDYKQSFPKAPPAPLGWFWRH